MYVLCLLYASNVLYVCMYVLYVPFVSVCTLCTVCTACMCVLYVCTVCTVLYTYTNNYEYQPDCSDHTRVSCDTQPKQSKNTESWKAVTYISALYIKKRLNKSVFPQQVQILSEWIYYTVDSTHPLTNLSYVFFMFIHLYPTDEL